jgi:hypothetical protein
LSAAAWTTTVTTGESPFQALLVAYVAKEITQARIVQPRGTHFVLLQFRRG